MFLKTAALKKAMKNSLTLGGLAVSNDGQNYIVSGGGERWGASVEIETAPNVFKALIMEMTGELPEENESWRYTAAEHGVQKENTAMPAPYRGWYDAKVRAIRTPLSLTDRTHVYSVYQAAGGEYLITLSNRTDDMFSDRELLPDEEMPAYASVAAGSRGNTLYFKSSTCIYWAPSLPTEGKVRDALFAALAGLDFSRPDWKRQREAE